MLPKRLVVDVTQEDIDLGQPGKPASCPIARAIKRQVGKKTVMVNDFWVEVGRGMSLVEYGVPESLEEFVYLFDRGQAVTPQEFVLDAID